MEAYYTVTLKDVGILQMNVQYKDSIVRACIRMLHWL